MLQVSLEVFSLVPREQTLAPSFKERQTFHMKFSSHVCPSSIARSVAHSSVVRLASVALLFGSSAAFAQSPDPLNESTSSAASPSQPQISRLMENAAVQNLKVGGVLEVLATAPLQNGQPESDRGRIRSYELSAETKFETALPVFAAKLTVGGFDNSGDPTFGLREGFVQASFSRSLHARVGKYFLPIGLYNQTRRSAWATPTAPQVVSRFFGDDGIVDTGIDLNWTPFETISLRAGVMNGYTFDAGETGAGLKPSTPTHYVRPSLKVSLSDTRALDAGLNYVGRIDEAGQSNRISGLDFVLAPKTNGARSWFGFGEILYRELKPANLPTGRELGATVYFEQPLQTAWALGLRADAFTIRSLVDTNGAKRSNLDWAVVPVVSYDLSKEVRLQGSYTYFKETRSGDSARTEQTLEIRLVTELGWLSKVRGLPSGRSSL